MLVAVAALGTNEVRFARGVSDPSNINQIANIRGPGRVNSAVARVSDAIADHPERG